MASATYRKKVQKKKKNARSGKTRKRDQQNKGTTPKFAIHKKK